MADSDPTTSIPEKVIERGTVFLSTNATTIELDISDTTHFDVYLDPKGDGSNTKDVKIHYNVCWNTTREAYDIEIVDDGQASDSSIGYIITTR